MSSREIRTYTHSDIVSQEAAVAAIDGRVILLAQILEQTTKGSARYWSAYASLLEMQKTANEARKDLESMRKGYRS